MQGVRHKTPHAVFTLLFLGFLFALSGHARASGMLERAAVPWQQAFDLDGDGKKDKVNVAYTGGAHCCYRFSVDLSSTGQSHHLPFELDGGYVGGLDLSRPSHFGIRGTDGSIPEIVMEISTYNGAPVPLPAQWRHRYGIDTHYVAIGFAEGKLRIRDWPRDID